jgi:chromosome segregation ATPase
MPRHISVFFFCGILIMTAGPAWAVQRTSFVSSADDLTARLQDFKQSVSRLEQANAEFFEHNGNLKERIRQGKSTLESLKQDHAQLKKNAEAYDSKTHKQSDELRAFETGVAELKSKLGSLEQEINFKQQDASDRLVRQKVVWDQLAAVKANGVADLAEHNAAEASDLVAQKVGLAQELASRQPRLRQLEAQIAYQSLLSLDPVASLPRLTQERDKLETQLAALSPSVKEKAPLDKAQIYKLKAEIAQLSKVRSERANLLQMLELQYDRSQKSARSASSEKKLQDSLAALKKDNRALRQQAADMRFEMIDLDKRKTRLEKIVHSSR